MFCSAKKGGKSAKTERYSITYEVDEKKKKQRRQFLNALEAHLSSAHAS